MKNKINTPNLVGSEIWGPYFWTLLNTLAKYADEYNGKYSKYVSMLMQELAFLLPCSTCRLHCLVLYNERMDQDLRNLTSDNLPEFIHLLKSHVNNDIKKDNISYHEYKKLLRKMRTITLHDLFKLLDAISKFYMVPINNYSENSSSVYYFMKALIKLAKKIPELKVLYKYYKFKEWKSAESFNLWLRKIYYELTNNNLPTF